MGDGGGDRYASVPERITWTTGFRLAVHKHVLGALSTFASFKTGKGARMSMAALVMRAELPRRTVERAMHDLEADRWISGHRRHRHATVWDIDESRLATTWIGVKVVKPHTQNLTATGGGQISATPDLSATGDHLTATGGGQTPDLTATGGGPIPCTSDPLSDHKGTGTSPQQLTLGPEDVSPSSGPPRFDASSIVDEIRAKLKAQPRLTVKQYGHG